MHTFLGKPVKKSQILEIDVAAKYIEEFEIDKAEIVRFVDGKETERKDITLEAMVAHNTFSYNWNPIYEIPYGSIHL